MTMTREQVAALLDGTTPGPLFVVRQNEPPHIWLVTDPETWVVRTAAIPAYTDRLPEQEANAALYAAAPDLARHLTGAVLMGFGPNVAGVRSGVGTLLFCFMVGGQVPGYLGSSLAFIGVAPTHALFLQRQCGAFSGRLGSFRLS